MMTRVLVYETTNAQEISYLEVDGSAEEVYMARKCHRGVKHDAKVANNLRWLNSSSVKKFDLGQASKIVRRRCYKELLS